MTLEVNEAFLLDDDRQHRLVFVKELLDRLQAVEKRCVDLEAKVNGTTWEPDANKRIQAAARAGRLARLAKDSSELEVGSVGLDSVGHGKRAAGVLADLDEEDSVTEQEGDVDDSVVYEIAAAARENHEYAVAGD